MTTDHPPTPPLSELSAPGTFKLSHIPFHSLLFDKWPGHAIARAGFDAAD